MYWNDTDAQRYLNYFLLKLHVLFGLCNQYLRTILSLHWEYAMQQIGQLFIYGY